MNHIYRSIWNEALGTWVAVSEHAKSQGKRSNSRCKLLVASVVLCTGSSSAWALPTGNELVAGQAAVSMPNATTLQIDQSSQRAAINWQGFSIDQHETVNIQQPNANAALLNRVVGQDVSQIQGKLNANGQVYLSNPNGVIFSKTAQVDVGGLVATTHNIATQDFMNGKNHFSQDGATGKVENHGTVNAKEGGVVALIGESVSNTGTINTPKGTTVLAAGKTVDLDMQGDGLVEVKVSEAALNAQINNQGAITADGGRVVMSAKAANTLIDTVINQEGIVKAQGLVERNGEIILDGGDNGVTKISSSLNASGINGGKVSVAGNNIQLTSSAAVDVFGSLNGGTVIIGDKQKTQVTQLTAGSNIDASSKTNGNAGKVEVFANMQTGQLTVQGNIQASSLQRGNGGFVETSAAKVKIADSAKVSTKANNGISGTWLIDPTDFTIASSGGDMTGAAVSSALAGGNLTIQSTSGAGGIDGDINVNDAITWSANLLTLNALNNININADLHGSGTAQLALEYGQAGTTPSNTANYFINGAKIFLPAGLNFFTQNGSIAAVSRQSYQVITSLGTQGDAINKPTVMTLQGIVSDVTQPLNSISGNYVLGADIDATSTSTWNGGQGFTPIGQSLATTTFNGRFDGLGHTITGLTINRPNTSNVGLFGYATLATIKNVGLLGGNIIGQNNVGGLSGIVDIATINNVYNTGNVTGISSVGGLIGYSAASGSTDVPTAATTVSNVYATGNITGNISVGGLIGTYLANATDDPSRVVSGTTILNNAYSSGDVVGTSNVGGLIGSTQANISLNYNSTNTSASAIIRDAYATGNVTGNISVGGLIGSAQTSNIFCITAPFNSSIGIINTYATGQVISRASSGGGLIGTTATTGNATTATNTSITLSNSFWDTETTGQSNAVGSVTTNTQINNAVGKTTAEMMQMSTFSNADWSIADTGGSSAIWRIYEGQTMPLLRCFLTPITIAANDNTITYNGHANTLTSFSVINTLFNNSITTDSNLLGTINVSGSGQDVGSYTVTPSGLFSNQQGYDISFKSGTLTITPAPLTIIANNDQKIFDGLAYQGGNGVQFSGFVYNENSSVLTGSLLFGGSSQGAIAPGTYTIKPSGFSAKNYQITYQDGTLTVKQPPIVAKPKIVDFSNDPTLNDNIVGIITSSIRPNYTFVDPHYDTGSETTEATQDHSDRFINNEPELFWFGQFPIAEEKRLVMPKLTSKNTAGRIKDLALSNDKQFLTILLEDGSVRVWDFQRGIQRPIVTADSKQSLTSIGAVNKQGALFVASQHGVGSYDIVGSLLNDKLFDNETVQRFITSDDGKLVLISLGKNTLSLWNHAENKEHWRIPYQRGDVKNLAFSPDQRYAAVLSQQPDVYLYEQKTGTLKTLTDALDIIDINTGHIMQSLPNFGENVVYTHFNDNNLQIGLADGQLIDWSMTNGKKNTLMDFAEPLFTFDQHQGRYVYRSQNNRIRIANADGDIEFSIENKQNPIQDAKLLADNKVLTVLANGDLALWDITSSKKVLRLFSTTQEGWTVMDAFGRFDGSDEAIENFNWVADEESIPLDSFSENYYEPGLLASILSNQDFLNKNPDMVQGGISLPPKVDIQLAEQQSQDDKVTLKLDVYDRGGGIDTITVYHNGKALNKEQIREQQSTVENDAERRHLLVNITPTTGKNTLKVLASNNMGIENNGSEISFDGKTKAYISSLRLLTVGVSRYENPLLNLKYSVADADLINDTLKNNAQKVTGKQLNDHNATKARILAELKELSQGSEQDVLAIYLAGHGMAVGKEWYFLPYETKLLESEAKIAASGVAITASELSDIFKDSKIQHIFLMVDACYSGAGLEAFNTLQNGQRYLSRRLGRSLGITVIAAAAKDQQAYELKSLGHGLFTYTVAQEITNNQALTAHTLAEQIGKKLPKISKEILGTPQDPSAYSKGNDFLLIDKQGK